MFFTDFFYFCSTTNILILTLIGQHNKELQMSTVTSISLISKLRTDWIELFIVSKIVFCSLVFHCPDYDLYIIC